MKRYSFWGMTVGLLCLSLLLTGCWDRRDIEERTSVIAMGIDKGEKQNYEISIQVPIPLQIAGRTGGGSGDEAFRIITTTGETVMEAFENLQKRVNQQLFIGHMRVIAISEEVAREGIEPIFEAFHREPKVRRLMWPIVVKGQARDMMQFHSALEQVPALFLMDLLNIQNDIQAIPDLSLGELYLSLAKETEQPLLYYAYVFSEDDIRMDSLAVFYEDKMQGVLKDEEMIPVVQIREGKKGAPLTIDVSDGERKYFVTFKPQDLNRKIDCSMEQGKPSFTIHLEIEGDLEEFSTQAGQETWTTSVLEKKLAKHYETLAMQTMKKLQKQWHADVLRLGSHFQAHCAKEWESSETWDTAFSEASFNLHYQVKIRRVGMEMK